MTRQRSWTDAQIEEAMALAQRHSASEVARRLGRTKNAVVGAIFRRKHPPMQAREPIRKKGRLYNFQCNTNLDFEMYERIQSLRKGRPTAHVVRELLEWGLMAVEDDERDCA